MLKKSGVSVALLLASGVTFAYVRDRHEVRQYQSLEGNPTTRPADQRIIHVIYTLDDGSIGEIETCNVDHPEAEVERTLDEEDKGFAMRFHLLYPNSKPLEVKPRQIVSMKVYW